jgi:hypothetical protein
MAWIVFRTYLKIAALGDTSLKMIRWAEPCVEMGMAWILRIIFLPH